MSNAETYLIIFLSAALGLFLILACVVLIKAIQVLNQLKSISAKAEKLADTAGHLGEFFRFSAGPVTLAKLLANISGHVLKKSKHRKE